MSRSSRYIGRYYHDASHAQRTVWRPWVRIAQVLVGLLFVFSGLSKGIDPVGTALQIDAYMASFGIALPPLLSTVCSVLLNVSEAVIGLSLLSGLYRRTTARATLVLMVPMTLLTLYILLYEPVADCGCFGDALKISNGATFGKNVVLLLLSLLLTWQWHQMYTVVAEQRRAATLCMVAGLLLLFNLYPLVALPVIDFRPYRVGTDLSAASEGAEGEYEYRFVYERDGVEQVFGLEELESLSDEWHFVRDESVELTPPSVSPTADLQLLDGAGRPLRDQYIARGTSVLLLLVQDPTLVSSAMLEPLRQLQEHSGVAATLVVGSGLSLLDEPTQRTWAADFGSALFMDRTVMKTLVRASPALVVIEDGIVVRKLSMIQLRYLLGRSSAFAQDPYVPITAMDRALSWAASFGLLTLGLLATLLWCRPRGRGLSR